MNASHNALTLHTKKTKLFLLVVSLYLFFYIVNSDHLSEIFTVTVYTHESVSIHFAKSSIIEP